MKPRRMTRIPGGERGSVFLTLLSFSAALGIVLISLSKLGGYSAEINARNVEAIKSYWAGEGALQIAQRYVMRTRAVSDSLMILNTAFEVAASFGSSRADAGRINGYAIPLVTISTQTAGKKTYSFECVAPVRRANIAHRISLQGVAPLRLNEFTFFSNTPLRAPKVWRDLYIDGNYHVNGAVRISTGMAATPHVTGILTTADGTERPYLDEPFNVGIDVPDYLDWGFTNVERTEELRARVPAHIDVGQIPISGILPENFTADLTIAAGCWNVKIVLDGPLFHVFRGNWSVGYTPDGTYDIRDIPNRIVRVEDDVEIKGVLDGQLTIVTAYNISIVHNVLYANRNLVPGTYNMSDDALALIAGQDIAIPIRTDDATGLFFREHGAVICASLFAPRGRFGVHDKFLYPMVQDIFVFGSILVYEQDPTMVYNAGGGRWEGMRLYAIRDSRLSTVSDIRVPGLGEASMRDKEFPDQAVYAWILKRGEWNNRVVIP